MLEIFVVIMKGFLSDSLLARRNFQTAIQPTDNGFHFTLAKFQHQPPKVIIGFSGSAAQRLDGEYRFLDLAAFEKVTPEGAGQEARGDGRRQPAAGLRARRRRTTHGSPGSAP